MGCKSLLLATLLTLSFSANTCISWTVQGFKLSLLLNSSNSSSLNFYLCARMSGWLLELQTNMLLTRSPLHLLLTLADADFIPTCNFHLQMWLICAWTFLEVLPDWRFRSSEIWHSVMPQKSWILSSLVWEHKSLAVAKLGSQIVICETKEHTEFFPVSLCTWQYIVVLSLPGS